MLSFRPLLCICHRMFHSTTVSAGKPISQFPFSFRVRVNGSSRLLLSGLECKSQWANKSFPLVNRKRFLCFCRSTIAATHSQIIMTIIPSPCRWWLGSNLLFTYTSCVASRRLSDGPKDLSYSSVVFDPNV